MTEQKLFLVFIWFILTGIFVFFTGIWFNITPDYNPTEEEKIMDKKISIGIGIFWLVWFLGAIFCLISG